jgi:hypothetical protein
VVFINFGAWDGRMQFYFLLFWGDIGVVERLL